MNRTHALLGKRLQSNAGKLRIYRLIKSCDSACFRRNYTFAVVLTILVALATALIAPSIDIPDGVLHEHSVSSHSIAAHSTGNLSNTSIVNPAEIIQSNEISSISAILHFSNGDSTDSSVVLRC